MAHFLILNWRLPSDPKAGGAEQVTLRHAQYWVQQKHRVTWLSGAPNGWYSSMTVDGIRYFGLGPSMLFFLTAPFMYWAIVGKGTDIIIDEVHGIPSFSPLWTRGKPIVCLLHELAGSIWNAMYPQPIAALGRFIEVNIFPKIYSSTPFWVDAPSMRTELRKNGFSSTKISVVPCAIESPSPSWKAKPEQETLRCLFLARLVPMKGLHLAVKVFAAIARSYPHSTLWIVGTGEPSYISKIERLVAALGLQNRVKFFGKVSTKKRDQLLIDAHFLLHTSLREGFGLTVLEAANKGTIPVVFDVLGITDLVEDMKTGLKVSFGDVELVAEKILSLYRDKKAYTTLSRAAFAAEQRYRWETILPKTLEELLQMIPVQIQRS